MLSPLASFLTFHKDIGDNDMLQHAIHMDVINARSTSSRSTTYSRVSEDRQQLREALQKRDVRCVISTLELCQASHIIPYAHENAVSQHLIWSPNTNLHIFKWIEVIVHSRPHNDEDVTDLTFNDVRNGILVAPTIHSYLNSRRVAFLKASAFATVTTMKLTLSFL